MWVSLRTTPWSKLLSLETFDTFLRFTNHSCVSETMTCLFQVELCAGVRVGIHDRRALAFTTHIP